MFYTHDISNKRKHHAATVSWRPFVRASAASTEAGRNPEGNRTDGNRGPREIRGRNRTLSAWLAYSAVSAPGLVIREIRVICGQNGSKQDRSETESPRAKSRSREAPLRQISIRSRISPSQPSGRLSVLNASHDEHSRDITFRNPTPSNCCSCTQLVQLALPRSDPISGTLRSHRRGIRICSAS